jgi:CRP/FNR family cyclic AMP-dependent transcriptional regulator
MNDVDKAAFLGRTWLSGLPEPIAVDAAAVARLRRVPHGQRLFARGNPPDAFYVIVSGQVRIANADAEGRATVLNVLDAGKFFGEVPIVDGGPRTHGAQCQGETTLLAIAPKDFLTLLERHPLLQAQVTRHICRYLRMAFGALEDNLGARVAVRAAKRLLLLGDMYGVAGADGVTIDLHLSQEVLASMLGVTRQSLGRCLRAWTRSGWIRQDYSRITIRDRAALEAIAGTR